MSSLHNPEHKCFLPPLQSFMKSDKPVGQDNSPVEQYSPVNDQSTSPYLNIPFTKWPVQQQTSNPASRTASEREASDTQPTYDLCSFCIYQLKQMDACVFFKNTGRTAEPSLFKKRKIKNDGILHPAEIYNPKDPSLFPQFNLLEKEERLRQMRTFFNHSKISATAIIHLCRMDKIKNSKRRRKASEIENFLKGDVEDELLDRRLSGFYLTLRYEPEILKEMWSRYHVSRYLSHLMDEEHNPIWTICPNMDDPDDECHCITFYRKGVNFTSSSSRKMSQSYKFVPVGPIFTI